MNKPAIVVVANNRELSLQRLLDSLHRAVYPDLQIPLIISIDKNENPHVQEIAENFVWEHGEKQLYTHNQKLGLRKHIIACGNLSRSFEEVIILEDDLLVSPFFYTYTLDALSFFRHKSKIAGISLYAHPFNETAKTSFCPHMDGYDNYFMQLPSSWGQCWTRDRWNAFMSWYHINGQLPITDKDPLPANMIHWPDSSWKKYFTKYMVEHNLYFCYPRTSLTTNFAEPGTHTKVKSPLFQTPLLTYEKQWKFCKLPESDSLYDPYCEIHPDILKRLEPSLVQYNFEVDLHGQKRIEKSSKEYFLTTRKCTEPIRSWSSDLVPPEENVILHVGGYKIFLAKKESCEKEPLPLANKQQFFNPSKLKNPKTKPPPEIYQIMYHPDILLNPTTLLGEIWGVTAYFNPSKNPHLKKNYDIFRHKLHKQGLPLITVELAFGDQNFELEEHDAERVIQLHSNDVMWQKERLLNEGLKHLPHECDKVVFLDSDVLFTEDDWIERTCIELNHFIFVQPFSHLIRLHPGTTSCDWRKCTFGHGEGEMIHSFGCAVTTHGMHMLDSFSLQGTSGIALAARRSIVDKHGIYDAGIMGSGDIFITHAIFDHMLEYLQKNMTGKHLDHYRNWSRNLYEDAKNSMSFVPGLAYHLWHGKRNSVASGKRNTILFDADFDPQNDIAINESGAWNWTSNKPELHKLCEQYFEDRQDVQHQKG